MTASHLTDRLRKARLTGVVMNEQDSEALDQLVSHLTGCPDKGCSVCQRNAAAETRLRARLTHLDDMENALVWMAGRLENINFHDTEHEPFSPLVCLDYSDSPSLAHDGTGPSIGTALIELHKLATEGS